MFFSKLIVRSVVPAPRLTDSTRYLFIGPHPDDIEIGAGATAAALAAAGKEIRFVICADGRYGTDHIAPPYDPDALAARRKEEALRSAALLGVTDVQFLDLEDVGDYDIDTLCRLLAAQIGDFRPEVIFAPDPTVRSESHPDHLKCGEAVRRLFPLLANPGVMDKLGASPVTVKAAAWYMTADTNRYIPTGRFFKTQLAAIFECHTSQYPPAHPDSAALKLYLTIRSIEAGLHCFSRHGEGFRVQAPLHSHCLPEAR